MLQACLVEPFPHALAQALDREGLAVLGHEKGQVAAGTCVENALQFGLDRQGQRHRLLPPILDLREMQMGPQDRRAVRHLAGHDPHVLTAELGNVAHALAQMLEKPKRKMRFRPQRMTGHELRHFVPSQRVVPGTPIVIALHIPHDVLAYESRFSVARGGPFEQAAQAFEAAVRRLGRAGLPVAQHLDLHPGHPGGRTIPNQSRRLWLRRLVEAGFQYPPADALGFGLKIPEFEAPGKILLNEPAE